MSVRVDINGNSTRLEIFHTFGGLVVNLTRVTISVLFFWGKLVYVTEKSSILAKEFNSSTAVGGCLTLPPNELLFLLRIFGKLESSLVPFS